MDLSSQDVGRAEGSQDSAALEVRDSWAGRSELSLYHSAQGSFGQSSTASSSAFASAMHIERSMVRSKIQRPPLAEEDEEGASDADSFFSASDEDHDEEDCRCLRTQTFTPYFYFEVYL